MQKAMMPKKQPEIVVAPDLSALVENAVKRIAARVLQADSAVAICLTGGSTPKPVYQRLATEPYRSELPWHRIHWFWGDDRFVLPQDERSNAGMARAAFLDRLQIPPANIHAMPTSAPNAHEAALQYENELKHFYGNDRLDPERPLFDLVLLGLGSDGHTASLFPGGPALSEEHRWVVGVDQAGLPPFVPRVSLTFPALASTREMMFLVSGRDKRGVVERVLAGQDLPAARAYTIGNLVWLMDRGAAPEAYPVSSGET
jgi:6-phosphogluconolactonase